MNRHERFETQAHLDTADNPFDFRDTPLNGKMAESKRSFTSKKLTWVDYLMTDHRQPIGVRQVGWAISQLVNEKTGVTFACDQTVADKIGVSRWYVVKARGELRKAGWIDWTKPTPRGPNHTRLILTETNINAIEAVQIALKDRREFADRPRRRM
jgi:hypothetical protein